MKTNANTGSKNKTRKNTAMLLVGFLTPVLLFGSLAASTLNFNSSEVKVKAAQKKAADKLYRTEEMCLDPEAKINKLDGNEEQPTITLNTKCIRFGDALLPNIGRF